MSRPPASPKDYDRDSSSDEDDALLQQEYLPTPSSRKPRGSKKQSQPKWDDILERRALQEEQEDERLARRETAERIRDFGTAELPPLSQSAIECNPMMAYMTQIDDDDNDEVLTSSSTRVHARRRKNNSNTRATSATAFGQSVDDASEDEDHPRNAASRAFQHLERHPHLSAPPTPTNAGSSSTTPRSTATSSDHRSSGNYGIRRALADSEEEIRATRQQRAQQQQQQRGSSSSSSNNGGGLSTSTSSGVSTPQGFHGNSNVGDHRHESQQRRPPSNPTGYTLNEDDDEVFPLDLNDARPRMPRAQQQQQQARNRNHPLQVNASTAHDDDVYRQFSANIAAVNGQQQQAMPVNAENGAMYAAASVPPANRPGGGGGYGDMGPPTFQATQAILAQRQQQQAGNHDGNGGNGGRGGRRGRGGRQNQQQRDENADLSPFFNGPVGVPQLRADDRMDPEEAAALFTERMTVHQIIPNEDNENALIARTLIPQAQKEMLLQQFLDKWAYWCNGIDIANYHNSAYIKVYRHLAAAEQPTEAQRRLEILRQGGILRDGLEEVFTDFMEEERALARQAPHAGMNADAPIAIDDDDYEAIRPPPQQQQQPQQQDQGDIEELPMITPTVQNVTTAKTELLIMIQGWFNTLLHNSNISLEVRKQVTSMHTDLVHHISIAFESVRLLAAITHHDYNAASQNAIQTLNLQAPGMNNLLKLKLFLSMRLKGEGYKKGNTPKWLYQQQWTKATANSPSKPTHFWAPKIKFKKWLNRLVSSTNVEMLGVWCLLNEGKVSLHQSLEAYFMHDDCGDDMLASVEPKRGLLSFRNGLYDSLANTFSVYDSPAYRRYYPDINVCAHNFFDLNYNTTGYDFNTGMYNLSHYMPLNIDGSINWDAPKPENHWSRIEIPFFDDFVRAQGWDFQVQRWFLISHSRAQKPVSFDRHQYTFMVLGLANTGKTTIINWIFYAMPFERVAIINPEGETTFGAQSLIDADGEALKDLLLIVDMNRKCNPIPHSTRNSMISGEPVSLPQKNENSRSTSKWEATIVTVGNEAERFKSVSKMLAHLRRTIFFVANNKPETSLAGHNEEDIIKANMATYLRKINLAHHEFKYSFFCMKMARNKKAAHNIWSHLPEYFMRNRLAQLSTGSATLRMFNDPEWFVKTGNKDDIVSIEHLRYAVVEFMTAHLSSRHQRDQQAASVITLCEPSRIIGDFVNAYPTDFVRRWDGSAGRDASKVTEEQRAAEQLEWANARAEITGQTFNGAFIQGYKLGVRPEFRTRIIDALRRVGEYTVDQTSHANQAANGNPFRTATSTTAIAPTNDGRQTADTGGKRMHTEMTPEQEADIDAAIAAEEAGEVNMEAEAEAWNEAIARDAISTATTHQSSAPPPAKRVLPALRLEVDDDEMPFA